MTDAVVEVAVARARWAGPVPDVDRVGRLTEQALGRRIAGERKAERSGRGGEAALAEALAAAIHRTMGERR